MSVVPDIEAARCVRYRFRYSECRRCEQACPHAAIRLSDEGVAIAVESCRHCGLCVGSCRTETFATPTLSPMSLIDKARGSKTLAVACEPCGAEADARVPCLGALGAPLLAYLARQGHELTLLGADHCAECSHGAKGSEQLAENLDAVEVLRAADLAGQWASISLLQRRLAGSSQGDGPRAARRRFFRRLASPGERSAARGPQPARAATPLRAIRAARAVPSAQRDLLQMLGLADAAVALPAHPALPVGDLRLDAGCSGCEACARACPTGALQVRENTTAWALGFEAGRCVACGVCIEACQPRVLRLRDAVAPEQFIKREAVALLGLPKRRCSRCDRSFVATSPRPLCDVCAGDEEDFDAIFG